MRKFNVFGRFDRDVKRPTGFIVKLSKILAIVILSAILLNRFFRLRSLTLILIAAGVTLVMTAALYIVSKRQGCNEYARNTLFRGLVLIVLIIFLKVIQNSFPITISELQN